SSPRSRRPSQSTPRKYPSTSTGLPTAKKEVHKRLYEHEGIRGHGGTARQTRPGRAASGPLRPGWQRGGCKLSATRVKTNVGDHAMSIRSRSRALKQERPRQTLVI